METTTTKTSPMKAATTETSPMETTATETTTTAALPGGPCCRPEHYEGDAN